MKYFSGRSGFLEFSSIFGKKKWSSEVGSSFKWGGTESHLARFSAISGMNYQGFLSYTTLLTRPLSGVIMYQGCVAFPYRYTRWNDKTSQHQHSTIDDLIVAIVQTACLNDLRNVL